MFPIGFIIDGLFILSLKNKIFYQLGLVWFDWRAEQILYLELVNKLLLDK
ncbi:hypothetical protein GCM10011350_11340 [Marinomonas arctica]|nr:hypothetical protein GCM10011350_11340 [Marinomonas arctica]